MKKLYLILMLLCMSKLQHAYAQTDFNNQLLVYFKSGVQRVPPNNTTSSITSQNVLNVLTSYGIPTGNVVPSFPDFIEADTVNTEVGESSRQMNRAKVFTISITNVTTKAALLNSLNSLSEVLYAESNGYASNNLIPADGRFGQQWGMRNTFIPGADIHAEQAWDIFTGNPNSIIAVIDNGVDINHEDLNTKIINGDNGFQIGVDGLGRQFSHGSHVAGIAAAITNNGANNGVAGVDWQARIHPKNIFDGNGDPDITRSIIDAVNFNANVWTLNNSWGLIQGIDELGFGIPGRYSITVRSAFAHAYRNNRVSCIAMGNHQIANGGRYANAVAFPAGFNSGIIAVGATNINDGIADFSARGDHIDVAAPGVGIWSINFNNNYIDLDGTSMATPHVAGLASLLKGFNPNLANDDIEQIIRITADDANVIQFPGFDDRIGNGRINAQRALQFLQAPNIVQHLNVTGGTVFNTSGNMTRIFLGVPGLADAVYVVRRSEVRTNVTLPAMCNLLGVWGRGLGTTGFREENGQNFGEGICEVVPGTLTNTSATLRTWIYEVWSVNGQYLGFYPKAANNVTFQYTVLGVPQATVGQIIGNSTICNSEDYSVANLPAGATVTWSIPSAAGPVLQLAQNTPSANQLRITNMRWYQIGTTLTASVNINGCPTLVTKTIANDNDNSATQYGTYSQPSCTVTGIVTQNLSGSLTGSVVNLYPGCMATINLSNMFGKTVTVSNAAQPAFWSYSPPATPYASGILYVQIALGTGGTPTIFNINGASACYQKQLVLWPRSLTSRFSVNISPNPVNNLLTVNFETGNEETKTGIKAHIENSSDLIYNIYELNTNRLKITQKSSMNGKTNQQINVSSLSSGYHVLQIVDGDYIQTIKFLKL